jgi:2-polyprenyl-6-methoxyphenol hydroxylase-like FAD-dependent oxidoreductase
VNLEALPTKEGTHLGVVLFRPNDPHITAIRSASDAKAFFYTHFPMMAPLLRIQDLERFASASDSRFQRFQYAGPELHVDSRAVLVGDSVHTVKPYFGFGVNAALEDALVLQQALRRHNCTGEGATTDPAGTPERCKSTLW